jgi:hypothetical protein
VELPVPRALPAFTRGIVAGQASVANERASHNLPVVGSSPTRPTQSDLHRSRYRLVVTSLLQSLMGTEWNICPGHAAVLALRTSAAVCSAAARWACSSGCVQRSLTGLSACPASSIRSSWSTPASRISELPICRPPSRRQITGTPATAASFLEPRGHVVPSAHPGRGRAPGRAAASRLRRSAGECRFGRLGHVADAHPVDVGLRQVEQLPDVLRGVLGRLPAGIAEPLERLVFSAVLSCSRRCGWGGFRLGKVRLGWA